MKPLDRIILSLDTTDTNYANRMIEKYSETIYGFKLNHLLFNQHSLLRYSYTDVPTLVDYKLFDHIRHIQNIQYFHSPYLL